MFKKSWLYGGLAMLVGICFALLGAEIILRVLAPADHAATIGHREAKNAALYGWGYDPGERFGLLDPDTNQIIVSFANSHGWRDRERTTEKPAGVHRILVLGDSNTFAPLVPDEQMYTRVLESALGEKGVKAEVINISYGGWSTDQQLEALINEGMSYQPDLVLLQFCSNDLSGNAEFRDPGARASKPFYYEISGDGKLVRRENPHFVESDQGRKAALKSVIFNLEVFKRVYKVYLWYRLVFLPQKEPYFTSPQRLEQLKLALGESYSEALEAGLSAFGTGPVRVEQLKALINEKNLAEKQDTVLRVLENRWFQNFWTPKAWHPRKFDKTSYEWRLFEKLLERMRDVAQKGGARFAVFSETDLGQYEWERSWFRISGEPEDKRIALQFSPLVRSATDRLKIDFIEMSRKIQRARNDPHPNKEGNRNIALNILDYLEQNPLRSTH